MTTKELFALPQKPGYIAVAKFCGRAIKDQIAVWMYDNGRGTVQPKKRFICKGNAAFDEAEWDEIPEEKPECTHENKRHYDGCLGYEAMVCTSCGMYWDHAEEHPADNWSMSFVGLVRAA